MPEQGREAERVEDHARIARENGEKIIARPEIALDAIARQQAPFTRRDLAQFAFRHRDGKDQFDQVMSAVRSRSEKRRGGKECVSTCRSRWLAVYTNKKKQTK